jgi:uncharacterized SAM-binding protein YcdF (DUF218 family)
MAWAIVIFGAAVRPDGRASPSLARRVRYGLAAARAARDDLVFCSGGVGRFGPSEASVMAGLLIAGGVDPARIVLDAKSRDTLQNVIAAARFVVGRGLEGAVVCTDGFHVPRARMLFAALGVAARPGPVSAGRGGAPVSTWLGMSAREVAAYLYDGAIVIRRRRELLRLIAVDNRESAGQSDSECGPGPQS